MDQAIKSGREVEVMKRQSIGLTLPLPSSGEFLKTPQSYALVYFNKVMFLHEGGLACDFRSYVEQVSRCATEEVRTLTEEVRMLQRWLGC